MPPEYGLINMNARLYDPVVGRFLSPDPYVQNPENTQSYNRYSHTLNNPLKYTDPSGEMYTYDWNTGLYWSWTGRLAPWSEVYNWLKNTGMLTSIVENGRFVATGAPFEGFEVMNNTYNIEGGGGGGGNYNGNTADNGWGMPMNGFYEHGKIYYNLNTHQILYLKAHINESGTTLVTKNPVQGVDWSTLSTIVGSINLGIGMQNEGWNMLSNASKNNIAYHIQRTLKDSGAKGIHTKAIKSGIASGLRVGGIATAAGSILIDGFRAYSFYTNGGQGWQVAGKVLLNTTMTLVGFLGPVGFGISATYFILDTATEGFGIKY